VGEPGNYFKSVGPNLIRWECDGKFVKNLSSTQFFEWLKENYSPADLKALHDAMAPHVREILLENPIVPKELIDDE